MMSRETMKRIKTWHERCEEHPDHQERIISERMIQERMQEEIDELRQALEEKQKTAVSPGKGTGFFDARALGITVLQPALETKQKTAVSPDGGTGFIDGVWHEPGPTAWQCQCGKPYTVTCISSKPPKREWVGLTDQEIGEVISGQFAERNYWVKITKALESKLKEKNT